jgi:glutathione synthase/RimK-type ligase-like ATP-grasp enzyme
MLLQATPLYDFIQPERQVSRLAIQRVKSKWAKTAVLLQDVTLRDLIPKTVKWSKSSLASLLDQFGMVYIKPENGTFGNGVMRAERREGKHYSLQSGTSIQVFPEFEPLANMVQQKIGSRRYLIQQGIDLLKKQNRRFDLRVMVQKNPKGKWETTGMIGRLSHPAKIVTNYHNGGTPMPIEDLMQGHLRAKEFPPYTAKLKQLGVDVAGQLQRKYPGLKEIGIDVAVDRELKPWILEVNTLPDPFVFRKLPDKKVFRKVYRYCVAYGRFKRKSG